ncbi:MAG TPA: sigma-70 family RNA polymerase sigma factor [Streptosporangiaceae bacterium]|nr:sigma-70 family RNA polymerase sigma factor [Streptosporangiaceae bacterium]
MDDRRPVTVPAGQPDRSARIAGLVRAARAGSDDALGQIVTELSPLLWQVARAARLNPGDAEDVLQTAWLRLISHLHRIHTSTALTGWLVITTRREAWRVRAAGRRQLPADQDWLCALPDQGPGSEEQAIIDDQRRALWAAISQLSARCQELLRIIAFVPRPDYQAVAAELGMPLGSVGPTRGRCLAKLRALLAGHPEGSLP